MREAQDTRSRRTPTRQPHLPKPQGILPVHSPYISLNRTYNERRSHRPPRTKSRRPRPLKIKPAQLPRHIDHFSNKK